MLKKYARFYLESFKLGFKHFSFMLFFIVINLYSFIEFVNLPEPWDMVVMGITVALRLAALGGAGYVTIKLLRTNKVPEKIFERGVLGRYWEMVKYGIVQLVVYGILWTGALLIFSRFIFVSSGIQYFWGWIVDFLFLFLFYQAIFWENEGIGKAYRIRNIFMLDKFEWLFPVYLITKLPLFAVQVLVTRGPNWASSYLGIILFLILVSAIDWIHNIFTFKVYGADRIEVYQKMRERVDEAGRKLKEKKRKKREGK